LFQSLIGRLKTSNFVGIFSQEVLFQSLIGRLKTEDIEDIAIYIPRMFQSLIGRLKTSVIVLILQSQKAVSIPYR